MEYRRKIEGYPQDSLQHPFGDVSRGMHVVVDLKIWVEQIKTKKSTQSVSTTLMIAAMLMPTINTTRPHHPKLNHLHDALTRTMENNTRKRTTSTEKMEQARET